METRANLDGNTLRSTSFPQLLPYVLCLSSPGSLCGYLEMFSDKQFRAPNSFRFSFIAAIFRRKSEELDFICLA